MGRKKRKIAEDETPSMEAENENAAETAPVVIKKQVKTEDAAVAEKKPPAASGYAMTSHAGVIVEADIYISDGSEDEEDDIDVVLAHSRTGLMRRGLLPAAAAPMQHRQWVRDDAAEAEGNKEAEEEDLSQLDPVQRAARLQAEKLRQEQQEKQDALLQESQQNAGRDPALFSKRTAFDIRFDQMEDKPWTRATDLSDFFNYGLSEEDWLEYAEQQMTIRQELMDAARAKRQPDPNIVPVTPKVPQSQQPRVAVSDTTLEEGGENLEAAAVGTGVSDTEQSQLLPQEPLAPLGPSLPDKLPTAATVTSSVVKAAPEMVPEGVGGAWGAGAPPGSHLAKLIEEQERAQNAESNSFAPPPPPPPAVQSYYGAGYDSNNNNNNAMDDGASQGGSSAYGSSYGGRDDYRPRRGGRGRGRGRGRGDYHNNNSGGWGGGGDDYYNRKRSRDDWRR
uniref:Pre-mRNA polyadenylation factor Fip1 domain-containing protein n=1 Tax=Amphora coffeiformis TaxID=265554 RepID=A0A7S3L4A9_9STRA|eukprot:scaffold236_cov245-Amphora_coffeaeformis.AAC.8